MIRTALFILSIALTACGDPSSEPEAESGVESEVTAGTALRANSSLGTFEAILVPDVEPIPMNEPFAVRLSLVEPLTGDAFVNYDSVTIDARMPAHKHGMLRDVELVRQADGAMLAEGMLFQMPGHWEIHVDVRRGAHIERAQLDVQLEF